MNSQQYKRLLAEGMSHKEAYIQSSDDPEATESRLQKLHRDRLEGNLPAEQQKKVDDLNQKLRGE